MIAHGKIGSTLYVPVVLLDTNDQPVTGKAFGSITAELWQADSIAVVTPADNAHWKEITNGAGSPSGSQGCYYLKLDGATLTTAGTAILFVACSGAVTAKIPIDVRANLIDDVATAVLRVRGLSLENTYTSYTAYSGALPTAWTLYLYDTAAHAATHDGATGLLASYAFAATYSGNNLATLQATQN